MYEHLRFFREEVVNEKRKRGGGGGIPTPEDVAGHGRRLLNNLQQQRAAQPDVGGFDQRRLLRLTLTHKQAIDLLPKIPGLEFISQEGESVVLAFGNEEALRVFEERLTTLVGGGVPTYKQLFYAIDAIGNVRPEDRTGQALRLSGLPEDGRLDVELLPVEECFRQPADTAFRQWLTNSGISLLDQVVRPGLLLYRVRCTAAQLASLLRYRDVRLVDLPPRFGLSREAVLTGVNSLASPLPPPANAPRVAILDSGVLSNHPLLAPAIGDARGFEASGNAVDACGHGTFVAGITLYGDVEAARQANAFTPHFWLLSGRLLDNQGEFDTRLIENQVDEAVRAFHGEYDCRIFNLSIGDRNRPYRGRHLRGLAFTLDCLARELGVLFIVSAGNFTGLSTEDFHWRDGYPEYLMTDHARIIDPATALNAITVGSIARYDATHGSQRHRDTVEEMPIALSGLPSPFTRIGPSVSDAIKPDFVAYGGNIAFNPLTNRTTHRGLGTLSLAGTGSGGPLFSEDYGTSFAAPFVTHLAGRLAGLMPEASANLLRALLAVNCRYQPQWSNTLIPEDQQVHFFGYGAIDEDVLYRSTDDSVTLYAEDALENERCHFYEIPIPRAFFEGSRSRDLVIAVSYMPAARTTRLDYKATQIEYRLVQAADFDRVRETFCANSDLSSISDVNNAVFKATARSKGTLQCDRWTIKRESAKRLENRLFVVVSRKDRGWAEDLASELEPYALAIQLRDHENEQAQHYVQIRETLALRVQQRQRARS